MGNKNKKIDNILSRELNITPESYNKENNTMDVIFATEKPVVTYNYKNREYINEILSCKPEHVRDERISIGPLLDNHNRWSGVKSALGTVLSISYKENQIGANLKLSRKDELKGVRQDIEDGIIRSVSVGYQVHKYERVNIEGESEEDMPTYRAIDWEPMEMSLVLVPADTDSIVRSENKINKNNNSKKMTKKAKKVEDPIIVDPTIVDPVRKVVENDTPTPVDISAIKKEERQRISDIRSAAKVISNVPEDIVKKAIEDNTSVDSFRELLFERLAADDNDLGLNNPSDITVNADGDEKKLRAIENAILLKADISFISNKDQEGRDIIEAARSFRTYSMIDMAKEVLEMNGVNTRGLSPRDVFDKALNSRGQGGHTTTDFPLLLGSAFKRTLNKAYDIRPQTFRKWASKGTVSDFRPVTRTALSGIIGNMDLIPENGEYKHATIEETGETYNISKFGKMFSYTWEAMKNDDLSMFSRLPKAFANRVAQLQGKIVYGVLSDNLTMSDGKTLFHADHNNIATPAALSINSLGEMRRLIRDAKDPNGDLLDLQPSFLIVGSNLEMQALILLNNQYTPQSRGEINPFQNQFELIVDPRITGNKYYVMTAPTAVDTVEYSTLEGESDIHIEQRNGWEIDGIEMKVRSTFGATALDYRGMVFNEGV